MDKPSSRPSPPGRPRYWVIVPAAGIGRRMGGPVAKQYLRIGARTILEWTVARLRELEQVSQLVLVLHPDDDTWASSPGAAWSGIDTVAGGGERSDSVLAGLRHLSAWAGADDWVLVHDAVRPCVTREDMERLMTELADDPVGGILASPVRETVKRAGSDGVIEATVERAGLWLAATPQMFRYGVLCRALEGAAGAGAAITDESSAVEALGLPVRLVQGRPDNIKITHPEDLALARRLLLDKGDNHTHASST